jgi:hypothetical protein
MLQSVVEIQKVQGVYGYIYPQSLLKEKVLPKVAYAPRFLASDDLGLP